MSRWLQEWAHTSYKQRSNAAMTGRVGPARGGEDLTNFVALRQIRTPSHADVADVRPRLPDPCRPLTLITRRGTVKTALKSRKNCSRSVVRRPTTLR